MKNLYLKILLASISLVSFGCSNQETIIMPEQLDSELAYIQSVNTQLDAGEISVADTFKIYNEKTHIFIDVREQDEYDEVHIKNVKLIPLATLESQLSKLSKTDKYVVVCRSGRRSKAGMQKMKDKGFNAVSMAGGMLEWESKGYPVERTRGK